MEVCQSPSASPAFPPSILSLLPLSPSLVKVQLLRSICVICLSLFMKLKYSCACRWTTDDVGQQQTPSFHGNLHPISAPLSDSVRQKKGMRRETRSRLLGGVRIEWREGGKETPITYKVNLKKKDFDLIFTLKELRNTGSPHLHSLTEHSCFWSLLADASLSCQPCMRTVSCLLKCSYTMTLNTPLLPHPPPCLSAKWIVMQRTAPHVLLCRGRFWHAAFLKCMGVTALSFCRTMSWKRI